MLIVVVGEPLGSLDALAAEISDYDPTWRMIAMPDAAAAMQALSTVSAAAVATGLQGGCGPAMLSCIRDAHPHMVRMLLLDDNDESTPMPALESAHRTLHRPLQAHELIEAIESIHELRELLDSESLKAFVGSVGSLPAPPKLYLALTRALQDPQTSPAHVADMVAQDPAMAAKVLRLCNSAFFSGGRTVTNLRAAVIRLGLQTLRRLVLASEAFGGGHVGGVDREAVRERAMRASNLAARLLDGSSAELAATAALLAEVGLLLPGVQQGAHGDGPHYAEAGAYLLGLWGLPMAIVEAVAYHHQPHRSHTRGFWVAGAVHVARALAAGEAIDERYLASVKMLDRLPRWRQMAEDLAAAA